MPQPTTTMKSSAHRKGEMPPSSVFDTIWGFIRSFSAFGELELPSFEVGVAFADDLFSCLLEFFAFFWVFSITSQSFLKTSNFSLSGVTASV